MTTPTPYPAWRAVAERAKSYLVSAEALALLEAWLAACEGDRPPARRDLRPERLSRILADIWLMDYERAPPRLRYRLAGENVRGRYDFPLVGKYLDEILSPSAQDVVLRYFLPCVEGPAIALAVGRLYHEWEKPGYGDRLLLPLLDGDHQPEGLVGITICKQIFRSRFEAEEQARRITCVLPLDGSDGWEEAG